MEGWYGACLCQVTKPKKFKGGMQHNNHLVVELTHKLQYFGTVSLLTVNFRSAPDLNSLIFLKINNISLPLFKIYIIHICICKNLSPLVGNDQLINCRN